MNLGVFLAIGESFKDFKEKGQDKLLLNYNLKTYSQNFDKVYVFSYEKERYIYFNNVIFLPNKYSLHRYIYSLILPLFYLKEIASCEVFRGLQITGGLPAILIKILFRKRIVVNYGYPYIKVALLEGKKIQAFLYKIIEKVIMAFCDKVIVTTSEIKKYLGNNKKIVLIPNGVNTGLFKSLKRKKLFSVIYVGRLEKQKNLKLLLNAVSLLEKKNRKVLFIGHGSQKENLLRLAKEKEIELKILDRVSHNRLPEFYNQAEMFILPSLIEGHPKALLEALSCGVPCIANDIEAVKSIIQDKKNGLIFDRTSNSLKKKISLILKNRKLAQKLGKEGRKTIVKSYDYKILIKNEIKLLKQDL
ncbi:MAG: glycosyltransferase family 4 protein [Candidatus Omnitrophica bacterium]|nr:glycosyltransferase family 4 protein [Candidatus Omnitrophota bacterium]